MSLPVNRDFNLVELAKRWENHLPFFSDDARKYSYLIDTIQDLNLHFRIPNNFCLINKTTNTKFYIGSFSHTSGHSCVFYPVELLSWIDNKKPNFLGFRYLFEEQPVTLPGENKLFFKDATFQVLPDAYWGCLIIISSCLFSNYVFNLRQYINNSDNNAPPLIVDSHSHLILLPSDILASRKDVMRCDEKYNLKLLGYSKPIVTEEKNLEKSTFFSQRETILRALVNIDQIVSGMTKAQAWKLLEKAAPNIFLKLDGATFSKDTREAFFKKQKVIKFDGGVRPTPES